MARPTSGAERAAKWARRRPAAASLLMAIAVVAVSGLALVLWRWRAAGYPSELASKRAASESIARADAQKNEALEKAARTEKERLVAGFTVDQGIHLCEREEVDRGLLWLARGLEHAVRLGDSDLE